MGSSRRWIPRTKRQLRRKCFLLMTSSWYDHMTRHWQYKPRKDKNYIQLPISCLQSFVLNINMIHTKSKLQVQQRRNIKSVISFEEVIAIWCPLYQHGLTLIQVWINYFIHYNALNENTYPFFFNFNGAAIGVWERISDFILHFTRSKITYPCLESS